MASETLLTTAGRKRAGISVVGEDPGPSEHRPGSQLGRYLIIDLIGAGGMGVVYRAYDPKLQREVALKCLRAEVLGEEARRRMLLEAHSMAKLNHPNVVAVYDVDAEPHQVVMAMELVDGQTLKGWMKDGPHPWRDVVERFVAAGRGLAAAHAAGIIHRDFKPANVLLGEDGRPRVTDFGIARLRAHPDSSQTSFDSSDLDRIIDCEGLTQLGQVMGTPAYMAPEQHSAGELGPAADQFAFCVSMWQALTGQRPYDRETILEVSEAKNDGPPPFPRNLSVPTPIVDAIRRGMEPFPDQRWPSMVELLEALSYDPSVVRRRWALFGVTTAFLAVGGFAVVGWQRSVSVACDDAGDGISALWGPDARQRVSSALLATGADYATGVEQRVERALDEYAERWSAARVDACEATQVRKEQSGAVLDLRFACLDRAELELGAVVEVLGRADRETLEKADEVVASLPSVERCADLEVLMAETPPPEDPRIAGEVETLRRQLAEARALDEAGKYAEARRLADSLATVAERVDYPPLLTEIDLMTAEAAWSSADYRAAERGFRDALRRGLQWGQWAPTLAAAQGLTRLLASTLARPQEATAFADMAMGLAERRGFGAREHAMNLAVLAALDEAQGDLTAAQARLEEALAIELDALGPEDLQVARTRSRLASVHDDLAQYPEAEREYRAVLAMRRAKLGESHPSVAAAMNGLAVCFDHQGRYDEAETLLRDALAIRTAGLGTEHPLVAASRLNLGNLFVSKGDLQEAESEYRAALAVYESTLGSNHPDVATARNNLANVLYHLGRYAESEQEYRASLTSRLQVLPPTHPDVAASRNNIGLTLYIQERPAEAIVEFEAAIEGWRSSLGADHPSLGFAHGNLALAHLSLGKVEEARAEAIISLEIRTAKLGPSHALTAVSHNNYGLVLRAAEEHEAALEQFDLAVRGYSQALGPEHADVGTGYANMGDVLLQLGRTDAAHERYEQALRILEPALGSDHVRTSQAYTGLGETARRRGSNDEAVQWFEKAWNALESRKTYGVTRAAVAFDLAKASWSQPGSRQRAWALATEAERMFEEILGADDEQLAEVRQWLQQHGRPGARTGGAD